MNATYFLSPLEYLLEFFCIFLFVFYLNSLHYLSSPLGCLPTFALPDRYVGGIAQSMVGWSVDLEKDGHSSVQ